MKKHKKKPLKIVFVDEEPDTPKIENRGTGAGGAKTNLYGKKFEKKTDNEERLLEQGYEKRVINKNVKSDSNYYLTKEFEDKTISFVVQGGLRLYFKYTYNIDLFRYPDEAYIFEYKDGRKLVKILEKKCQNVDGTMETKLWSCPSLKREYELILGEAFKVQYGLCVNDFLKRKFISDKKKYNLLKIILKEHNIDILFGEDENYFQLFDVWINNSL